jgi:hypothetical protein
MTATRNKLYLLMAVACTAGYVWLFTNLQSSFLNQESAFGGCLIKQVTNIPCPSCGSTHSIISLLQGDIIGSLLWNPIGILIFIIMTVLPLWLAADLLRGKDTLFKFYQGMEGILQQRRIAIPAIALITLNWIWNIYKGL